MGGSGQAGWLSGRLVLVIGLARSGLAAAELLRHLGARVLACDGKPAEELPEALRKLGSLGCLCLTGPAFPLKAEGADLVVLSPGVPRGLPVIQDASSRKIPIIGELELASRTARGDLIAVTGTNGKTTTVSLLGDIFRKAGRSTHVAGNIGYPFSSAALKSKAGDSLVVEVSSFQLEGAESFHPRIAALLNVTPDHLDRHGSFEEYLGLKKKIFRNQEPCDISVLNRDDGACLGMADGLKGQIVWFSRLGEVSRGAFVRDGCIHVRLRDAEHTVCPISCLKIPGSHNLENALAAAAVSCAAGLPADVVGTALQAFSGVEHRLEFVREFRGVRYINDSKGTNPDSTIKAVETMLSPTVLIAGGYDKHIAFGSLARSVASSGRISRVILIGQTAEAIERALRDAGYVTTERADSLAGAVCAASLAAETGGSVLFSPACASFDMFADYEERGRRFKDSVHALA